MHPEKLQELLESACASIQYRIRRDILGESALTEAMQALQAHILRDEVVEGILQSQNADGWFGPRFHGYNSHEVRVRLLCEKGLAPRHPALVRALNILQTDSDRPARELGLVGRVLDEYGYGGTDMMRATILAYAGIEDNALVKEQIAAALHGFRATLEINSIDEIARPYKGKTVFRPGVPWPGIYHLRMLAFTHGWRNPANREMVTQAIQKLVELSPLPPIYVLYKSQIIAPASFGMQDFNPCLTGMDAPQWMMWFQRMELLSRLGVVAEIPMLQGQVDTLQAMFADHGWPGRQIIHAYFKKWGAYTGLMLERDWRTASRRAFDLAFRNLLIQHYSAIWPADDL